MGFMKRFFSLGKRTKKRRPELEADEFDPPVSVEYLDAEATMTRLLRSSSARQSMGGSVQSIAEHGENAENNCLATILIPSCSACVSLGTGFF
jgi:hypothetical protein